jgi:predicted nucleotidyltransferase
MDDKKLLVPHSKIADSCRRHHIRKLSLFGSVLRDDFGPGSDVDVWIAALEKALPPETENE